MNTIPSFYFVRELKEQWKNKDNYTINLEYNGGQYKYRTIYKCIVGVTMYYMSDNMDKAYKNLSSLKKIITRQENN
jgi:hypothetical protein